MIDNSKSLRRSIPEDVRREVVRLYVDERLPSKRIAERLGIGLTSVINVVRSSGHPVRRAGNQTCAVPASEVATLYRSGLTNHEVAARLGISPSSVSRLMRSVGEARRPAATGEAAHTWRGGRSMHAAGYVRIFRPEHPRAGSDGYVMEHVVVAEEALGRLLADDEVVHHRNHIKNDNRPDNLAVMSAAEHRRLHGHEKRRAQLEVHLGLIAIRDALLADRRGDALAVACRLLKYPMPLACPSDATSEAAAA